MTFTASQLLALLPLLLTSATLVALMLAIAWRRNHEFAFMVTIAGLNAALLSVPLVMGLGTQQVTPLLVIDSYALFYSALVLVGALATCTFARSWLKTLPDNREEFYLLLIATAGGLVLAGSRHLASLFIGIEMLTLPMFGLVAYARGERHSLEAGVKYMVLSAASTGFLLFGMALLYAQAGSLSFADIGKTLTTSPEHHPLLLGGIGMMLVGFGFKLSLAPFHLWTPDVYEGSPAPVATFLATVSKVAVFCVLLRFYLAVPAAGDAAVQWLLTAIAILSILIGNLLALMQSNIKRMLGYSSISHFGYLLTVVVASRLGQIPVEAAGVYLLMYLLTNLGSFGVVSMMSSPFHGKDADSLHHYRGLFWKRPYLTAVLTVMMLSLAGIPMTLGFIGKFYLVGVTVEAKLWWLAGAIVLGSALGLFYYLRVMVTLYLREPGMQRRDAEAGWHLSSGGVVVLLSAILVVLLGILPQPVISLVRGLMTMQF
ncbi:NADH-quinone oxidoreductase subunit NuoN [Aeromonas simiae]|uniref:NADH-quinone oxidoreductase subunit NuoN n=1 Tax=Aeromonas simiae TaxID=218936 RepID=UPI00266D1DD3|nr:NADH-quinone oxidoreductase subunit NuoN [Aeromonas simiae]MDO2949200.1 NADH-quinone oxidoreductase subunit NuoN [Aeromonas simiae]MDO2956418.1 NADH-quinone oxidoreductase subunit NuoN [Aeromonas simiae]